MRKTRIVRVCQLFSPDRAWRRDFPSSSPFVLLQDMLEAFKAKVSSIALRWQSIPSAVKTIGLICLAVFTVQWVCETIPIFSHPLFQISAADVIDHVFGLYWPVASSGALWQPVTYIFLHGSWLHLLMNMVGLFSFGTAVEYMLGGRRFWLVFIISGVIGGLSWMLADYFEPNFWEYMASLDNEYCQTLAQKWAEAHPGGAIYGTCVGASGAVFGLIGAFTALFPKHRVVFLLFFVLPVKMQTRYMAMLLVIATLAGICWGDGNIAHVAHLFGGLAGYVFAKIVEAIAKPRGVRPSQA